MIERNIRRPRLKVAGDTATVPITESTLAGDDDNSALTASNGAQPMNNLSRMSRLMPAIVGLIALSGCLDTEFIDAVPLPGTVVDGSVDAALDGDTAPLPDAASADVTDATTSDAGPDATLLDVADTVTAPDATDTTATDVGPVGLPLGQTCTEAEACASGKCEVVADGVKVCTKVCDGDCPAGMRCTLNPYIASETIFYCMPLPGDLCKPCESDADCTVGVCQNIDSSGESLCGLPCDAEAGGAAACPTGFVCQSFFKGELCVPSLGTCSCAEATAGASWPCGIQTPKGECVGVQTCGQGAWSQCTANLPTVEKCDGQDNDCNGQIDEGLTLTINNVKVPIGGPCGTGICSGGEVVCGAAEVPACSTDFLAIPKDICGDNQDNDCDGDTDEGCPPKDTDGDKTPDLTDCAPYDSAVYPGAKEACCLSVQASDTEALVDVTDGSAGCDKNCDGKVKTCLLTDQDGDGFASPADCDDKNPDAHPGGKEKCDDGVDQDCIDGDLKCSPGQDGDGDGWPVGIDCNDSAAFIHPGAEELCNFIDDDCDGVVDDGNPGGYCADPKTGTPLPQWKSINECALALGQWFQAGAACGAAVGACQPGTLVCSHVGLLAQVTCTDAKTPQPELCNGADDNCDGKTDEDFTDLGKPCDGDDIDECANGVYVCGEDGVAVVCGIESKFDLLEQCDAVDPTSGNGKDEDCDGQVDEACYGDDVDGDGAPAALDCNDADAAFHPNAKETKCCDPALKGDMPNALALCDQNCDGQVTWCDPADLDQDGKFGKDDCNEGDPKIHVGAFEMCGDGVDQDCDKVDLDCDKITDNDGDFYAPGAGGDCDDFNPNVNPGATEKCNRKDDNCDGVIDEGNPQATPGACGSSDGVCKPGKEVCVQQKFKAVLLCVPEVPAASELCDNLDNNCNGKTDEYFPEVGQPCDGPDTDKCANGFWQCAADGSKVACVNEVVTDIAEICDGVDNDCDGLTDEEMTYFNKPLGAACVGQGGCGAGTVVCSPELQVAVCSTDAWGTTPESTPELCDGIDNDCDGFTDEGMAFDGKDIGAECVGNGACGQSKGIVQCAADKVSAICSTMLGGSAYKGSKEVCDGVDNDCDGHVDEDLLIADSDCHLSGLCSVETVLAKCVAGAWQCNYDAVVGYQPEKEVLCDGIDNDCDGETDEDFNVGLSCDGTDTDLCKNGVVSCSEDKLFSLCGTETKLDIVESCNGVDDDCDGETDDGFQIGKACDGFDTDQCPNGTWTCTSDGQDHECVNEAAENLEEVCDGADNDCDGTTDEGFPDLGAACDGPDSDKCANGVKICSPNKKATVCGQEKVENIVEACTGADDDCDGETDEGQQYKGKSLGANCQGLHEGNDCGPGKVVCSPGKKIATCSSNPDAFLIFDGAELCDGLDNDCDGKTDEELAWKGIKLGAACDPPGVCGVGSVECNDKSKQVTCSTLADGSKAQASKEVCDGKDNDCDGAADEELVLADSECKVKGLCTPDNVSAACAAGAWNCNYTAVAGYEEAEVSCDGIDNDCDGQTDEGFQLGEACDGDDSDQCKNGTWACAADGKGAVCDNETLIGIPEVCDGLDNDCNGKTDETFNYFGLPLGADCDGLGECGAGKVICGKLNQLAVCSTDPDGTNPQSKAEICNSKDDDCDGKVDDGLTFDGLPVGAPCSGIGACGLGTVKCSVVKPVAVCSVNPDGPDSKAQSELCNGKDDDCDGKTDEDVSIAQTTCNTQGVCAKALTTTCTKGAWTCTYAGAGYQQIEVACDDLDNNCDGKTDENYPDKGKACDGDDPDKCKKGLFICAPTADKTICGPEQGGATAEICDNIDNDCDGEVDETFPELGQVCDGPDTDSCANGTFTCAPGGKTVQCVNEFPKDVKELCDGQDNDCDGKIDEDFAIGTPCDGPDADQCKFGAMICGKDGQPVCGPESKENIKELCNDIDDDCDGQTDEGFGQKGIKCGAPNGVDDCKTGTLQCGNSGAMECVGDYECAIGTACQTNVSNKVPDKCICGPATLCSEAQGNNCVDNKCTCGSGAACGGGQVCQSGTCKPK